MIKVLSICAALLFMLGIWGFDIQMHRPWKGPAEGLASTHAQATRFIPLAGSALLAGFRGIAADLLWIKSDTYWHHGQWQRLLPLYRLIVTIQPRFTLVWSVGGWHMAYNLSERARQNPEYSPTMRQGQTRRWVDKGILFLQEGLKYNEDKPDLFFDLGWTYYDKLKDYVAATDYLERAAVKSNWIVPKRLLAHAYAKAGRRQDALRIWKELAAQGDSVAGRWIKQLREERQ